MGGDDAEPFPRQGLGDVSRDPWLIRDEDERRRSHGYGPLRRPVCPTRANCDPARRRRAAGPSTRDRGHDGRRIPIETSGGGASGPQRGYAVRRFPACVAQRPRSPDVLRRVQAPAARHRRGRDPGLARLARPGRGPGGREPGPIPDVQAAEARAPAARRAAEPDQHPLHQHDQPRAGAVLPRRRGARAPDPAAGPLERGGDGPAREQPVPRPRRPPRDVRVGGQPVRGGLQPLLQGQGRSGRRRPGVLPGPRGARHLRPGLPRGPPVRGPARPLPARGGRQRA